LKLIIVNGIRVWENPLPLPEGKNIVRSGGCGNGLEHQFNHHRNSDGILSLEIQYPLAGMSRGELYGHMMALISGRKDLMNATNILKRRKKIEVNYTDHPIIPPVTTIPRITFIDESNSKLKRLNENGNNIIIHPNNNTINHIPDKTCNNDKRVKGSKMKTISTQTSSDIELEKTEDAKSALKSALDLRVRKTSMPTIESLQSCLPTTKSTSSLPDKKSWSDSFKVALPPPRHYPIFQNSSIENIPESSLREKQYPSASIFKSSRFPSSYSLYPPQSQLSLSTSPLTDSSSPTYPLNLLSRAASGEITPETNNNHHNNEKGLITTEATKPEKRKKRSKKQVLETNNGEDYWGNNNNEKYTEMKRSPIFHYSSNSTLLSNHEEEMKIKQSREKSFQ
jgi:hypothetical protein